ncbi:MAG: MATE family efflux transporter [Solobacterium sp.]|nr:MATE family efflux transporter [Solobacterium sp.]
MNKRYQLDMTEGRLLPKILLFSLPLMASSVLQLLFNAADVVVVGKFAGSEALAAVSSTTSLINLITQLFIGLSIGVNVVVAKHIGERNFDKTYRSVSTSIIISLVGGVIVTVVGFLFCKTMLQLMGSPDDVIDLSALYLKIYFLGTIAMMLYNYGSAILRAQGDTQRPLKFLTLSGVLNVILNLIFVIVLKMSVAGVALATIISQYISAVLIMICLMKEKYPFGISLKEMTFDAAEFKQILVIGLPAGIQGTVFALSNVTVQSSINSFGKIVMAGNGAASNLEGFVYVAMNTFYQSAISFTSQNLGAKKYERLTPILFTCLGCVLVTGAVLGIGLWYFGDIFLSIYSSDPEVISAGIIRLSYIGKIYFLCGTMDVLCGCLRGMGYSLIPMINSLLGSCAFRLVWLATVFKIYHTQDMVYIVYPLSWIITIILHLILYIYVRKKMQKNMES